MINSPDRNDRRSLRLQIRTEEPAANPTAGSVVRRRTTNLPAANEPSRNRTALTGQREQISAAAAAVVSTGALATYTAC